MWETTNKMLERDVHREIRSDATERYQGSRETVCTVYLPNRMYIASAIEALMSFVLNLYSEQRLWGFKTALKMTLKVQQL